MTGKPASQTHGETGHSGGGHGWMMIVCCIPMLVIAVALVASGVVSAGFLLWAVGCTAMMFLMMRMMGGMGRMGSLGGGRDKETRQRPEPV